MGTIKRERTECDKYTKSMKKGKEMGEETALNERKLSKEMDK
jgi:hypothetical protein